MCPPPLTHTAPRNVKANPHLPPRFSGAGSEAYDWALDTCNEDYPLRVNEGENSLYFGHMPRPTWENIRISIISHIFPFLMGHMSEMQKAVTFCLLAIGNPRH